MNSGLIDLKTILDPFGTGSIWGFSHGNHLLKFLPGLLCAQPKSIKLYIIYLVGILINDCQYCLLIEHAAIPETICSGQTNPPRRQRCRQEPVFHL